MRVCDSIACELAGSRDLLAKLPGLLGSGVRVLHAPCIGRCETAPAAVVGQNPVPHATTDKVAALVTANAVKHPERGIGSHPHLEIVTPGHIDYAAYQAQGGYELAKACSDGAKNREEVIAAMEDSGLRGLGGAGFPAGRKWGIVAAEPAPRLLAINIDEGEPGTFKDRYYLERDPHRFLEGALIAAWAVGIAEIYIYLRDEYHGCRAILEREVAALQANPPCPVPPVHLRRGAGAYICGEESAMIESIEGKRGEPRLRPPYVAQVGLFNRPTLEHNMETLHWVRDILEKGPAWFSAQGRHGRKGLRSFSVSGRVKKPGVHLAPAGITVKELIEEYCDGMLEGHSLYGYLPGGASGGILPASMGDIPLDFDTLSEYGCFIGSAAIVILSDQDRASDAARNLMNFFAEESCGPMHALPRRHRQGAQAHGAAELGPGAAEGAVAGDDGRFDLWVGAGGAEPGPLCDRVLSGGNPVAGCPLNRAALSPRGDDDDGNHGERQDRRYSSGDDARRVHAERWDRYRPRGRDHPRDRKAPRRRDPSSLLQTGAAR